ncbi:hypothetical protein CEXT_136461 [Caerostris extrusa]|uniref:Uncharacterized protein n=1 Tax=Caerostris extrusa TaxID=172846 RepID=A0AAV4U2E5_CAEEX|nr:hypothetical protein CEXT_136461 [Caerostris extrusa]
MPFSSFLCEENGSVTQLNFNNLISQTARATIASCISVSGHRRRCHSQLWVYVSLYGGRLEEELALSVVLSLLPQRSSDGRWDEKQK